MLVLFYFSCVNLEVLRLTERGIHRAFMRSGNFLGVITPCVDKLIIRIHVAEAIVQHQKYRCFFFVVANIDLFILNILRVQQWLTFSRVDVHVRQTCLENFWKWSALIQLQTKEKPTCHPSFVFPLAASLPSYCFKLWYIYILVIYSYSL